MTSATLGLSVNQLESIRTLMELLAVVFTMENVGLPPLLLLEHDQQI